MSEHSEAGACRWSWAGGTLHSVQWEDEVVAFHYLTASTHLLDRNTSELLSYLREVASENISSTAALLEMAFGEDPLPSNTRALNERLQALAQAGLVTSVCL